LLEFMTPNNVNNGCICDFTKLRRDLKVILNNFVINGNVQLKITLRHFTILILSSIKKNLTFQIFALSIREEIKKKKLPYIEKLPLHDKKTIILSKIILPI
jgi:hypothetical protein